jgi:membrane-associated phospholipid phosphatase
MHVHHRSSARVARLAAALMLLATPLANLAAQDSAAVAHDSTTAPHDGAPFFTGHDLVTLLAAGAVSAGVSAFDLRMARWWNAPAQQDNSTMRSIANDFTHVQETTLTLGSAGLYLIGRLTHRRTFADVMFHTTASIVTASIVSQAIRGPVGRKRPIETNFDDAYRFQFMGGFTSFANRAYPSLHAASNFAAATALVMETHRRAPHATWIVAPIAYGLATIPPVSRLYLGRHWGSDIVMGAAIGVMAGVKVVGYSHDHPVTPVDRIFLGVTDHLAIAPGPEGTARLGYQATF